MFLFGVVRQSGGHSEAHVAVFAMERFLSRVQTHVVLEGRGGGKLGPAFLARERPLFEMFGAFMIKQACNKTQPLKAFHATIWLFFSTYPFCFAPEGCLKVLSHMSHDT